MKTREISSITLDEFSSAVMLLKHRAGQLGLFKTMHALEAATQAVGWELAEQIDAKHGTRRKDAERRAAAHRALG